MPIKTIEQIRQHIKQLQSQFSKPSFCKIINILLLIIFFISLYLITKAAANVIL